MLRGSLHQHAAFAALAAGTLLVASAPSTEAKLSSTVYVASLVALFTASAVYHRFVIICLNHYIACLSRTNPLQLLFLPFTYLLLHSQQGQLAANCRPTWSPWARAQMKKIDHASIFILIAGALFAVMSSQHVSTNTFLMHKIRSFFLWLTRSGMCPCLTGTYTPIAQLGVGGSVGQSLLMQVWAGAAAGILQSFFWSKAPKVLATSIYIGLGWIILPHAREVRNFPP